MMKNSFLRTIKDALLTLTLRFFWLFPIKNDKIVFESYYGDYYNDNPKMISNKLIGKGLDIVWVATRPFDTSDPIRQVDPSTFRYIYDLATARVWVDNCRKSSWVRKRKGQYYIQTWHGNLGNKRTEGAALDKLPSGYVKRAEADAAMTDLMISGSTFFNELIRNYFWYNGEILECGTPRLDAFFLNDGRSEAVKTRYGIPEDAGIVLYAPTYRENKSMDCYKLDFELLISTLERKTGTEWVVLVRLHPNVARKKDMIRYDSKIISITDYPDLYDIIPISDIVISDYSSLTFEAGLLDKPVFLFALDLDDYIQERGFYIDIRQQPYILTQSNSELMEAIADFDREDYLKKLEGFNASLGIKEDGGASQRVADRIMAVMLKG